MPATFLENFFGRVYIEKKALAGGFETQMNSDEKFDIKKLPRLEIVKPIDGMLRWFLMLMFIVVPLLFLLRSVKDGYMTVLSAVVAGAIYAVIATALYYGVKQYYVLDRVRNALFRVTRIFGSLSESYICAIADINCVAVDSRERTTKNGGSTGQYWYETCLILKNGKIVRLHRTFEDSYDEIQDAEQYAEYLGVQYFNPKPGLEMVVVKGPDGKNIVEFRR